MAQTSNNDLTEMGLRMVLTEKFDPNVMLNLLRHNGISDLDKRKLKKYYQSRKNGNEVEVAYDFVCDMKADGYGRLYAKMGMQGMPRSIRNALAGDLVFDVDVHNCHPTLLVQLCDKEGWACHLLRQYVNERDNSLSALMTTYQVSREDAKRALISTLYLGNPSHLLNCNVAPDSWLGRLACELKHIATNVKDRHKELFTKLQKSKKVRNALSSTLSWVLQTEECKVVRALKRALESQGEVVRSLIHDGLHVDRAGRNEMPASVLEQAVSKVKETTGYNVRVVVKPMETDLVFEEEGTPLIINDDYAAGEFVKLVGRDKFIRCQSETIVFDDSTGLWTTDRDVLWRYVHRHSSKLLWMQNSPRGTTVFDYGGCAMQIGRMLSMLSNHIDTNNDFWEEHIDTSIGKLLFEDGILDMATMEFTEGFDPSIVFVDRIPRPFRARVDAAAKRRVHDLLFVDPFTTTQREQGLPAYQAKAMARILAGNYRDRTSFFNIGDTSTGKGLLAEALSKSTGSYMSFFNIKSFMLNTLGGDAAKNMSFLAPIKYKRGAISNEPPLGVTLDGNFFKTVVSAGDGIVIRQNHQNEYTVRVRCTFLINGNDMPKISPLDDAVRDRIHGVVPYNIRFSDVESELRPDKVKRKDVAAKDLFNDPVYQDAFLSILLDAYHDFLADGHALPPSVLESKKEWLASGDSLDRIIEEKFYITGLESDFIPFTDIKRHVAAQGQHYSDNKLGRELGKEAFTSKGVRKGSKRFGRAMVKGYTGLIEIPRDSYGTSWDE